MLRLDDLVRQRQHTRFAWGAHDCCLWAADAVVAVTGNDPVPEFRGAYDTREGAAQMLALHGSPEELAASRLGVQTTVLMAQVGDIGLIDERGEQALCVCAGQHWLAAAPFGLSVVPAERVLKCWRVC